jgi:hypothetical protein
MDTPFPSSWLAVGPGVLLLAVVVLLAAGLFSLALRRWPLVQAVIGRVVWSGLSALLVLALLFLIGSAVPWPPGTPAPSGPTEASGLESSPVPAPLSGGPLYQSPFGSIADDIRLMPLERSLPGAITSLSAPVTPPRS